MGGGARFAGAGPNMGGAGGFEDVFANLFGGARGGQGFPGGFGGGFPGGFGGGFGGPTPGADLTASVTIDFIDGVKGTTKKLSFQHGEDVSFKVPAGIKDGGKVKLRGRGQPSMNGGANGDLIVTVTVKPHPVFTRDGDNLRVSVPVTFVEAALGATIQVPTLGGDPVKLKVAPGTPNGRVLRVKGKGVVTEKHQGDLLATVEIAVPSHLSHKAEEALKAFAAELPDEDPRAELLLKAGLL
jgi:molecular chaperone DnaJ